MFKRYPFFRQPDQMDCGPTCLKMVARFYGKNYSLQELRERCETNRIGSTMLHIKKGAEAIGFTADGYRLTPEALEQQQLPCIAHWNQQHYVVVYRIRGNDVLVADPMHGLIHYTMADFLAGWSSSEGEGVVLTLVPGADFKNNHPLKTTERRSGLRQLAGYVLRFRRLFMQLLFGLLLGSIFQLLFPFITQSIVDNGISNHDLDFVTLALLAQLLLFLGRMTTEVLRSWILLHIMGRVNILIVGEFFIKLMKLPVSYFDRKLGGDILQRIEDNNRIEQFLTNWSLTMLFNMITIIVFSLILAIYSMKIFLVSVAGSILYIAWVLLFMKKRAHIDYSRFMQISENQNKIIEIVSGMQEIKTHHAEQQKKEEWEKLQVKLYAISMKGMRIEQWQNTGSALINELKNILITFLAARLVISDTITLGMMLSVSYIIGQLNGPVSQMAVFSKSLQDALLSLGRLAEVYELQDEEETNEGRSREIDDSRPIVINGLSFKYPGSDKAVLENISLQLPANKVTAIVGSSGSGKTTLMKILLGFYDYSEGSISVGGKELKTIHTEAWRSRCGVVMQEGYIFSDTVSGNIALGSEKTDPDRLAAAVNSANLQSVIDALPMRLETRIGHDGAGLSSGQKQRILIARAIYKNPAYLFFDEATSALDSRNEKIITQNLGKFFSSRTAVVIAHRLSTIRHADQIIVLENGRIAESGTHEELVSKGGAYFNLVKNQLELAQ